jgi:hypothetical protein
MSISNNYTACPFCKSMIHVNAYPCISMLHVHAACLCMSIQHAHGTCPVCMSILLIHAACPCFMFMMHVHTACPCCLSMLPPCCISMLLLHDHVAFQCFMICCMSIFSFPFFTLFRFLFHLVHLFSFLFCIISLLFNFCSKTSKNSTLCFALKEKEFSLRFVQFCLTRKE